MTPVHSAVAILPVTDLDRSEAFYGRLGFARPTEDKSDWLAEYRILHDAKGASIHLYKAGGASVQPEQNPAALYLYTEEVDALAGHFPTEILERGKRPENKPWGMYEFSLSDPDGALVRIGWPARLRQGS